MITESVEIKRYNAIRENEKSGFSVVDGEIYECYCYEKIVNEHPEFFFVKLEKNKENKNGFWISSDNNLYYQSDEIDLGEFDILGFDKEGILNWWEITRQNTNFNIVIDKIERKRELLKKLFDSFKFYLVLPEYKQHLKIYEKNFVIISEPNYKLLRKPEYTFKFKSDNFCSLSFLNQKAKEYSFIDDLINLSKNYYKGTETKFESHLFERLYDIQNIRNDKLIIMMLKKTNLEKSL